MEPSSQPQPQPLDQDQDLLETPESESPEPEESPEPVESPEPESPEQAPEPESEEPVEPSEDVEPEAPETPEIPEWKTLDEVDLEQVPESVRPWMERTVKLTESYIEELRGAKADYEQGRDQWVQLVDELKGTVQDGRGVEGMKQTVLSHRKAFDNLARDSALLAVDFMSTKHPEFEAAPANVKDAFFKFMDGNPRTMFPDVRHEGELASEVWRFVCHRHKYDGAAEVAPLRAAPKSGTTAAKKQAVVNDGARPHATPRPSPADLSDEEILDRYDHLLG